ncbi:GspH/FimT family protein [Halomonas sp. HNIBRBA4712]|uniref:GspH/FimT family protein n=1 Tax=Halomonas sp. HNIBRBA4712 TaxID=3373087 RepID=UPI003745101F
MFAARAHVCRSGFTFLELLVALALAGLLALGSLSPLRAVGHSAALKSEANRFQQAFALARNTAITQRTRVVVCPLDAARRCDDDWSRPLAVILPAGEGRARRLVRVFEPHPQSRVRYNRRWRQVHYTPLGHASGFNGTFELCNAGDTGRRLVLSQLGRLRVDRARIECA